MPTTDMSKLAGIRLTTGAHSNPDNGLCLMEAVAYVVGEPHTDRPACVSGILGQFGRQLNDRLPYGLRQELVPLIPQLPGTAGDGIDETRGYLALDWLIRVYTPTWLTLAGLTEQADELRSLDRIVDLAAAERARPVVLASREKAAAARAAAGAAAGAAAWDAAGAAAWDAARATAGAAAWDAARNAAGGAAGDAAWNAARAAVWAAADAAGDALAPTVVELQRSAVSLFKSMIRPAGAA